MSSVGKKGGRTADPGKREAILDAATRAFFQTGFAATAIEQVAADAGVSKVTIYNHFGDKRGLFVAAVETECEKLRDQFAVAPDMRGSLRDRLTAIGEAMVSFLSRPEMVQFERRIAAETEHDPAIGAAFLASGPHRMKAAFAGLMRAMVDAGEVRIDDVDLAVEQFASMCKGMGDLERRFGHAGNATRDRERIEGAVEVFCRAYAVDKCERK